ncbi:hypothetical protein B0H10DRAFT_1710981, partial [Mycena sp. CBHHK59/15]
ESLQTMQTVAKAWKCSPDGESKYGPILLVALDRDVTHRAALFMMCMHSEILPGNPLFPFICNLLGLNHWVGKNNLMKDFDYRHLYKRELSCS